MRRIGLPLLEAQHYRRNGPDLNRPRLSMAAFRAATDVACAKVIAALRLALGPSRT
jgi:hypothetical protein